MSKYSTGCRNRSSLKIARVLVQHGVRGRSAADRAPSQVLRPADEAGEHAGLAVGRGVVERVADRAADGEELAGQVVLAPERMRVDGLDLHQRAHREPLRQLGAMRPAAAARSRCVRRAAAARRRSRARAVTVSVRRETTWRRSGLVDAAHRRVRAARGSPSAARPAGRSAASRRRAGVCCAPPRTLNSRSNVPWLFVVPGRGDVGEDEQERQVARLGADAAPR